MNAHTLTVTINAPAGRVYAFVSNPENLARWAAGLGPPERRGDEWWVPSPSGPARVEFAEPNTFGVLDHTVFLPNDLRVYVPMRVVPNGDGSEVSFTLFQLPGMPDEQFRNDRGLVQKDLESLKRILEGTS